MTNQKFGDNGCKDGCGAIVVLFTLCLSFIAFCTNVMDHIFKWMGF